MILFLNKNLYRREQGRKATQMQPVMTAEAERMLSKLRTMQTEIDGLRSELRRKEAALEVSKATIERLEVKFIFLLCLKTILNLILFFNI